MIRNKPYSTKTFGRQIESGGLLHPPPSSSSSSALPPPAAAPTRSERRCGIRSRRVDRVRASGVRVAIVGEKRAGEGEGRASRRERVEGMEGRSAHARLAAEQLRAATLSLVCRNPVQIYTQLSCQQCLKSLLVLVPVAPGSLIDFVRGSSDNRGSIVRPAGRE